MAIVHSTLSEMESSEEPISRLGWSNRSLLRVCSQWMLSILIFAGIVGIWEAVVALNDIPHWKLPAPSAIATEMWVSKDLLLRHTWVTLQAVLIGFSIALVAGIFVAANISLSRTLERIIYPSVIASQTVPIVVIAPLLLIWLGYGMQHKVIVVALISIFPIVVNTVDGLKAADPDMINLLRTMGANRWQVFCKVQVPTCLPFLFSGIKIAVTVSVIGAVIGEWVGSSEGLGYLAIRSKSQFLSERVYAASVMLSILGIGLFLIIGLLERMLLPWYYNEQKRRAIH
jgi:putative hydroxymethylpyrimidine transport system permease protein